VFVAGVAWILFQQGQGYHEAFVPEIPSSAAEYAAMVKRGWSPPSQIMLGLDYLMPYLDLWIRIGGLIYLLVLIRRWPDTGRMVMPSWIAAGFLAAWTVAGDLAEYLLSSSQMTEMGEPPAYAAYAFKILLDGMAPLFVPMALHYHASRPLMQRYTLETFLQPLVFCFIAFSSLWIIMDVLDHMRDFQIAGVSFAGQVGFYMRLLPFIFVTVMPASLLLSVLYALTKMSRANEIISMLGAGMSVNQVLRPIFIAAAGVSCLSLIANYYWSPRAEGNREAIVRALGAGQQDSIMASEMMFRNEAGNRVWYVSTFPFSLKGGRERMRGIQIRQFDDEGRIVRGIVADSAMWWPNGLWRFYDGREVIYEDGLAMAQPEFEKNRRGVRVLDETDFPETPWSMVSSAITSDYLSVPELVSFLKAHETDPLSKRAPFITHFWHRFALPWQGFALVLVAAPLGIAFSRRGSLGGIAASIFIFFTTLFVNDLFLNLGKGGHLPGWFTVWMPHLLYGSLGLLLLHYRSQNKDLPKLRIPRRPEVAQTPTPAPASS
jgi:LPS export ABC transporter permease LptG